MTRERLRISLLIRSKTLVELIFRLSIVVKGPKHHDQRTHPPSFLAKDFFCLAYD